MEDVKGKENTSKVDGKKVNLNILQHELISFPLSLATTSGILHYANNFLLAEVLTEDVTAPTTVSLDGPNCLLIDGQALVMHGSCQTTKHQNIWRLCKNICQYCVQDGGHLHEDWCDIWYRRLRTSQQINSGDFWWIRWSDYCQVVRPNSVFVETWSWPRGSGHTPISHCIRALMESMVVSVRDTDVLVQLLASYDQMGCSSQESRNT